MYCQGSGNTPQLQMSEMTLMHVAATAGHTSIAQRLRELGLSPSAAASSARVQPLHLAATGGNVAMLRWLLQAGVKVDAPARGDLRPIHFASLDGHLPLLEALLSARASPSASATRL